MSDTHQLTDAERRLLAERDALRRCAENALNWFFQFGFNAHGIAMKDDTARWVRAEREWLREPEPRDDDENEEEEESDE